MAVVSSAVEMINLALDLLKQDSITSIDPATTQLEAICARWYDNTRRSFLEMHPWNFASKRASIPRTETPAFGYNDAYDTPSDFIRVNTIGQETDFVDHPKDYQIEDNQILVNRTDIFGTGTALPLRYVYDKTTIGLWAPTAIIAFSYYLAIFLSQKITGLNTIRQEIKTDYLLHLQTAKSVDGQQCPPRRITRSNLLRARKVKGVTAGTRTVFE